MIPNSNTARPWRALAGAIALAASLSAPASHAADPFEMEWRELAQGVWVGVRPVSYRSPVMTNTTVVIGDKGVLVFDAAGFAIQGERLVEESRRTDRQADHAHRDQPLARRPQHGGLQGPREIPGGGSDLARVHGALQREPQRGKGRAARRQGRGRVPRAGREGARHRRPFRRHAGHAADARLLRRAARALRLRQRGSPAPGRSRADPDDDRPGRDRPGRKDGGAAPHRARQHQGRHVPLAARGEDPCDRRHRRPPDALRLLQLSAELGHGAARAEDIRREVHRARVTATS